MKKTFGGGVVTAIIGVLAGFILNDWSLTVKVCGYLGGGCLLLVAIFSGVFIGANQHRANYYMESKESRQEKSSVSKHLLVLSIPNLIAALLVFMVI